MRGGAKAEQERPEIQREKNSRRKKRNITYVRYSSIVLLGWLVGGCLLWLGGDYPRNIDDTEGEQQQKHTLCFWISKSAHGVSSEPSQSKSPANKYTVQLRKGIESRIDDDGRPKLVSTDYLVLYCKQSLTLVYSGKKLVGSLAGPPRPLAMRRRKTGGSTTLLLSSFS